MTTGMVVIWSGAILDIPDGWVLCDGNNGTPDLRNRFIIGAGDSYAPAETGGALTHTHSINFDSHEHSLKSGSPLEVAAGTDWSSNTEEEDITGGASWESNLNPYYALAYIMKT